MGIVETVSAQLVKTVVSIIGERLSTSVRKADFSFEERLERYLYAVVRWSEAVQIYGMPQQSTTDLATVSLNFSSVPRSFRSIGSKAELLIEDALLTTTGHSILLGDPGAGKTTTLKRLARKVIMNEPVNESDSVSMPVVLRLRELGSSESLVEHLQRQFGLDFANDIDQKLEVTTQSDAKFVALSKRTALDKACGFLDVLNALVLVDGLDEIPHKQFEIVLDELRMFAQKLTRAKVIVSCRSGRFEEQCEGFRIFEVCPLNDEQKAEIINLWATNAEDFSRQVSSLPYRDVVDRPLLLVQLIVIHNNFGFLPEKPSDVIRRLLHLLLEAWDSQRGIKRESAYANFIPDRKLDFLSTLSYHLLYPHGSKVFTERELVNCYVHICDRFGLPASDATRVVRELESHNGIIVGWGDRFEFSHLSIQEYLCGYYLVREPSADLLYTYLASCPDPIAIACALSPNPNKWFSSVFLKKGVNLKKEFRGR